MLDYRPDRGIVESHLERCGCDDDIGGPVNTTVLGRSPAQHQALCEGAAETFQVCPVLSGPHSQVRVRLGCSSQCCEGRTGAVGISKDIPSFSIAEEVVQAVRCVEVVGESEDAAAVSTI